MILPDHTKLKHPILKLMELSLFTRALETQCDLPCSDQDFHNYFFVYQGSPSCESVACILKLDKLDYIQNLLNNYSETGRYSPFASALLARFFSIGMFPIVEQYIPEQLDNLIAFQHLNFQMSYITNQTASTLFFSERINLLPQNKVNFILLTTVSFLEFIYSKVNEDDDLPTTINFTITFINMIITTLLDSHNHQTLLKDITSFLIKLDEEKLAFLLPTIYFAFRDSIQITTNVSKLHPHLSKIFSNPKLCALAFLNNNENLLPFCDVEACIKIHPQEFV